MNSKSGKTVGTAPPVYRPPAAAARPAPPPVYRPAAAAQPKRPASARAVQPRAVVQRPAPPVYRPAPAVQRATPPPAMVRPPARPTVPVPAVPVVRRAPVPHAANRQVLQRLVLTVGHVDDVIARSAPRLARAEGRGGYGALETVGTLSTLPVHENLVLDAHGASFEQDEVAEFAAQFGGMRAEALADTLVAKGFPAGYNATVYLNGCDTATENSGQSYARRFQMAMALRNRPVRVQGNAGSSQVQEHGGTWVNPATAEGRDRFKGLEELVGTAPTLLAGMDEIRKGVTSRGFSTRADQDLMQDSRDLLEIASMLAPMVKATVYRDEEDLRPTLEAGGALHYQREDYRYKAIPPDKHPTLASRIATVLNTYDDRFWKWRSGNSKEARDILRVLCNTGAYQKLYVALKWYLTNAPRPPASFVTVTPKLLAGELKTRLTEAFRAWKAA